MQEGNLSGIFGIATDVCMPQFDLRNTSMTTDGTYLYLYI